MKFKVVLLELLVFNLRSRQFLFDFFQFVFEEIYQVVTLFNI